MEVKKIYPPITPFLQVKLDHKVVDYLWKIINIAKTNNVSYKNNLAGNISQRDFSKKNRQTYMAKQILF